MHTVTVDRPDLELARVVREAGGGLSWNKARELCRSGRVRVDDRVVLDPGTRVDAGAQVSFDPSAPRLRSGGLAADAIVYVDADVVVVNKPAGLLSVPFEHGDKDTLIDLTRSALRRRQRGFDPELSIVHRIDIDTTGLMVFARNLAAKRALAAQFRAHSVHRRYLAIAHGYVIGRTFDTLLVRDRGDGLRGSFGHFRAPRGQAPADAQRAITHVRLVERLRDRAGAPASLVECALETGRQHQIRVHLSEAGHPLVGERVYIRDYRGPRIQARASARDPSGRGQRDGAREPNREAARPMLHACELGFAHPRGGRSLAFRREPPADFQELLSALRPAHAPPVDPADERYG